MADNAKRDAVILFYNSREGSTDPLRRFQELSNLYYMLEENKEKVSFGYYDLGKNSHQALRVKNESLFLRIYKLGNFSDPIDWEFRDL